MRSFKIRTLLFFIGFGIISKTSAQFGGSVFPGWTTGGGVFGDGENLMGVRIGTGATYWDYRNKPLKWSANLDFVLYEQVTLGLGAMGENDYYVYAGTHLYKDEGFEIEAGIQRVEFSSYKAFSNNIYANTKFEIEYPFYAMLESTYAWKTNNRLMDSRFSVSARIGLFINLKHNNRGENWWY